jgi:hypothetical protein
MAAIKSNKKWYSYKGMKEGYQMIPFYQIKRIKAYNLTFGLLFFLVVIFFITTFSSCIVTTYGKSPKILDNDEIEITLYKNAFAGEKHVKAKLQQVLDKELTARNCTDYLVLYDIYFITKTTFGIKLFKFKEDKLSYIIKKEEFIKLAQKNIKIGMSYDEIESLIKISSSGFKQSKGLITTWGTDGQGKNNYSVLQEYTIGYFLYLKIVNGSLVEWKINQ